MTYDDLSDVPVYDSAEAINTPERIAAYIEVVLEENDPALLAHALGVVARAKGMTRVAEEAGRTREALYKTLSESGNPRLDTLMSVLKSFGLRLAIRPIAASHLVGGASDDVAVEE